MPKKQLYALAFLFFLLLTLFLSPLLAKQEKILGVWDKTSPTTSHATLIPVTPTVASIISSGVVSPKSLYPVVKVIDGDTIAVSNNGVAQTIRLIGINTPESVDPRKPVECFGKEASGQAHNLLDGRSVVLIADPTQGERDKYNRLLRYVFRDDGLFFNQQMIEDGYAYEYTYATPYLYQDAFNAAEEHARSLQIGLWNPAVCGQKEKSAGNFVDKDCKDFTTQQEAQDFFISQGGPEIDPHKLDVNHDGTVCESLP